MFVRGPLLTEWLEKRTLKHGCIDGSEVVTASDVFMKRFNIASNTVLEINIKDSITKICFAPWLLWYQLLDFVQDYRNPMVAYITN